MDDPRRFSIGASVTGRIGRHRAASNAEMIRFKHIELISTQGRQVLMVIVMDGGEVSQQV